MALRYGRMKMGLAGILLSTSVVTAQQAVEPASTAPKTRQPARPGASRTAVQTQSLINGVALNRDQTPLAKASVRLRNLEVNAIEQTVTANELGRFSFMARPLVPYVVEIADQAGRTLAVGDVIVANAGEVAGARLMLPTHLPALAVVFDETASAVTAAAADTGLTVVDPKLPKVSPSQ